MPLYNSDFINNIAYIIFRFTISGGKIGKHISIQRMIDISKFVNGANKHQSAGGPYQYRLASMVIHLGGSQHGGHYTAVAEASSGTMFEFDDSSVSIFLFGYMMCMEDFWMVLRVFMMEVAHVWEWVVIWASGLK